MKLHLGCGRCRIPGWYHIDAVDFPHVDLRHEIDHLPMIPDDSVELIYTSHTLEHFHRRDTQRVLGEWLRVLRPGGLLRLSVPDFAALARIYQATGCLSDVIGPLFGRQDYLYNIHYTVFDRMTLAEELVRAGFREVREWDWRATEHAAVDDYSRATTAGIELSVNLEAVKPGR